MKKILIPLVMLLFGLGGGVGAAIFLAPAEPEEPKIRDKFLQVLFNHANNGGFSGNFTEFRYLQSLKDELLRNAKLVTQGDVTDVLILDLVRQDS